MRAAPDTLGELIHNFEDPTQPPKSIVATCSPTSARSIVAMSCSACENAPDGYEAPFLTPAEARAVAAVPSAASVVGTSSPSVPGMPR